MADENVQVPAEEIIPTATPPDTQTVIPTEPTAEQIEWKRNMDGAFETDPPPVVTPPQEEIIPPEIPPVVQPDTVPDYIKDLGFTSIEDAKTQVTELRKLKDAPPPPVKEIEFSDPDSKKLYELFRDGSPEAEEIIFKKLEAKRFLAELDTMSDENKLKRYIKIQNPKFDQELIDDEYKSLYSIDEKADEYIGDSMKLRKDKLRMEQRKENDMGKAKEHFTEQSKKVELPDITPQAAIATSKELEDYKASQAEASKYVQDVIVPGITAITEDKLKMSVEINDANNQMQFGVSIIPTKEDLEAAKQSAINFDDFMHDNFYDKDNNFLPENATTFVLRNKNFDKYIQSAARQAVNAERTRVVETKVSGNGVNRDTSIPVEKTEFQKNMENAFS